MNASPHSISLDSAGLRKSRWWRIALWVLFVCGLLALWGAFTLIDSVNPAALQVTLNGTPMVSDLDLGAMQPLHKLVLATGIAIALLVALVVAIGGVLVALTVLVPIVLFAVLVPLLATAALLLVLLSPLALLGWAMWRALRPAPRSTTMAA